MHPAALVLMTLKMQPHRMLWAQGAATMSMHVLVQVVLDVVEVVLAANEGTSESGMPPGADGPSLEPTGMDTHTVA